MEIEELNPRIVNEITPREEEILRYSEQGMKIRDIAEVISLSRGKTGTLLKSAKKKAELIQTIHSEGEIWIGEIPGLPAHCVLALQKKRVFTVSDLMEMSEYEILKLYEVGPKSIEALRRYRMISQNELHTTDTVG